MPAPIRLSLVSVVWNDLVSLPALLESIWSQVPQESTEVIFVDNGSTDDTVEYLRDRGDVTVIENGVNAGYPAAMNRGARRARGEYVVLSNPDLIYRPGALPHMMEELERQPDVGGVSPVILVPPEPGRNYPLLETDPGIYYGWNFFSGFMVRFASSRFVNFNLDYHADENTRDLAWIHGCCGMFRREALRSVGGGFDERFFIYFEDADLGRSLRKKGWRLRMARQARVLHLEDQTCKRIAVRSRVYFMESWHKYHRKHSRWPVRAVNYTVVLAALLLQTGVQLLKRVVRRETFLPQMLAYLRVHLGAPFRDLEGIRRRQLAEIRRTWKPYPTG